MSPYASGAMIKDIVNEALIVAIRHGRDFVTWPDVIEARVFKVHGMPDGMAATKLEQYETASTRRRTPSPRTCCAGAT